MIPTTSCSSLSQPIPNFVSHFPVDVKESPETFTSTRQSKPFAPKNGCRKSSNRARCPTDVPQSTTVPPGCSARRMAPSPAAAALRISVVPFSTGLPSQRYTGRLLRNTPSGSSFFRMVTFRHIIKRPAHSRRKGSRKIIVLPAIADRCGVGSVTKGMSAPLFPFRVNYFQG